MFLESFKQTPSIDRAFWAPKEIPNDSNSCHEDPQIHHGDRGPPVLDQGVLMTFGNLSRTGGPPSSGWICGDMGLG